MKAVSIATCLYLLLALIICQDNPTTETQVDPRTPSVDSVQAQKEEVLRREENKRDSVGINYDHIQSYTFEVKVGATEDFILQVDHDHDIRGILAVYWLHEGVYVEANQEAGEDMRMLVYENRRQLLVSESFFKSSGFNFHAHKGNEYLLRFVNSGRSKLMLMNIEHYVPAGKTSNALSTEHALTHDMKIRTLKDKLMVTAKNDLDVPGHHRAPRPLQPEHRGKCADPVTQVYVLPAVRNRCRSGGHCEPDLHHSTTAHQNQRGLTFCK